jgi:hypothetical protein
METHRVLISPWILLVIVAVVLGANCCDETDLETEDRRVGFRFGMCDDTTGAQDFIAVTGDDDIIASARAQLLLPIPERTFHIHGEVTFGNPGYNLDWSWHFIQETWVLAEESVEVCDVSPSAIAELLENLPDTLDKIYACPLSSYVKSEAQISESSDW